MAAFNSPSSAGVYAPWRGGNLNDGAISKAEKEFVGTKLGEARLAVVVSWLREKVPAPVRFLVTDDLIRKAVQTAFDAAKSGLEVLKNA